MKTVVSKAQAMREVQAHASRFLDAGISLKREATRLWKYLEPHHGGQPLPKIEVRNSMLRLNQIRDGFQICTIIGASYAHMTDHRITLTPFASQHTLAHELVHIASRNKTKGHSELFYRTLHALQEKRWRMDIRMNEVKRWGYDVDHIIEGQLENKYKKTCRAPFHWERSIFANPEKANPLNSPMILA